MVAIPLIWSGDTRTGLLARFALWIDKSSAALVSPEKPVQLSQPAHRRPEFLEYAAMSREMHRL